MKKDILEIVKEYGFHPIPFGELYKIVCVFHDDHDPSLVLYPSSNSFFCFSCSTGGDVLNFVQRYEGISRVDAKMKVEGFTALKEACAQLLDAPQVKEEIDYSDQLNMNLSRYCRDLFYKYPTKVDNIMKYLAHLDKEVLQKTVTYDIMEREIKASRELDK